MVRSRARDPSPRPEENQPMLYTGLKPVPTA
jgi:hypothetical protein